MGWYKRIDIHPLNLNQPFTILEFLNKFPNTNYEFPSSGGLVLTGKATDLKSVGPKGPWGFESLALRPEPRWVQGWCESIGFTVPHSTSGATFRFCFRWLYAAFQLSKGLQSHRRRK